jgi:protein associated with RNAse G/E
MQWIDIVKQDHTGKEVWRYRGQILLRTKNSLLVEAYFDQADMYFHGILLRQGDRFLETYYSDRWYNIFEMHDREDDQIKGWYCNICFPAVFKTGAIFYCDLALDLLVFPDGKQLVLDWDEFVTLPLEVGIRQQALGALHELKVIARRFGRNFDPITNH